MGTFDEKNTQSYDWDKDGVYVIEPTDYVEGGEDGVSNRQAKQLTKRTRNLHDRVKTVEQVTTTHGNDAVRHITADERTAWDAKETPTGAQTKATTAKNEAITTAATDASTKSAAVLQSAKEYANGKDTTLRNDMATADTATLRSAKTYADTIVAALVDNSPEALNTLQELAKALGNDPNFATTVMNEIGKRVKITDFDTALAGKLNQSAPYANGQISVGDLGNRWGYMRCEYPSINTTKLFLGSTYGYATPKDAAYIFNGTFNFLTTPNVGENQMWHAGNLAPASTEIVANTLAQRDGAGYLSAKIFKDDWIIENQPIGAVGYKISQADGYHRFCFPDHFKAQLGLWSTSNFDPATKADSITILNSDLNTLMKSGIYTVDGASIQNAPHFSANWRVFVASSSVGRVTQIAQPWDSDRLFFRRKQDGVWHPWREVYHSGNFDPNSKMNVETTGLMKGTDLNTLQTNGFYNVQNGVNAPCSGWIYVQIIKHSGGNNWVSQTVYSLGASNEANRIFHRNGINTSEWSSWVELYSSGNLVPATTSANGLMSAADKAKLDSFIRGSVNADGSKSGTGFEAYKQGNNLYVRHSLGHTNYMAVATVNGSNNGPTQDNEITIISKTSDAVGFLITNGVSGDPEIAAFDFIIMSYW